MTKKLPRLSATKKQKEEKEEEEEEEEEEQEKAKQFQTQLTFDGKEEVAPPVGIVSGQQHDQLARRVALGDLLLQAPLPEARGAGGGGGGGRRQHRHPDLLLRLPAFRAVVHGAHLSGQQHSALTSSSFSSPPASLFGFTGLQAS